MCGGRRRAGWSTTASRRRSSLKRTSLRGRAMSDLQAPGTGSSGQRAAGVDGVGGWSRLLRRNGGSIWSEPAEKVKASPLAAGGHTPLTDPRALGTSLAFHIVLLAVASVAALTVRAPAEAEAPAPALR